MIRGFHIQLQETDLTCRVACNLNGRKLEVYMQFPFRAIRVLGCPLTRSETSTDGLVSWITFCFWRKGQISVFFSLSSPYRPSSFIFPPYFSASPSLSSWRCILLISIIIIFLFFVFTIFSFYFFLSSSIYSCFLPSSFSYLFSRATAWAHSWPSQPQLSGSSLQLLQSPFNFRRSQHYSATLSFHHHINFAVSKVGNFGLDRRVTTPISRSTFSVHHFRTKLGDLPISYQVVTGSSFPPLKVTIHLHLVPMSSESGTLPPRLLYTFMVWWLDAGTKNG